MEDHMGGFVCGGPHGRMRGRRNAGADARVKDHVGGGPHGQMRAWRSSRVDVCEDGHTDWWADVRMNE